jgi:hypothetical protein
VNLRPNPKPGLFIAAFALAIAGAWLFWNAQAPAIAQTKSPTDSAATPKTVTEVLGPKAPLPSVPDRPARVLPLPKGEGRGEGERRVASPASVGFITDRAWQLIVTPVARKGSRCPKNA